MQSSLLAPISAEASLVAAEGSGAGKDNCSGIGTRGVRERQKASLHGVRRKRKCRRKSRRKGCSHVERKRKQNVICMRISVSQGGGNLVPRVCVTLDQQSGNENSWNEIKDGGGGSHLGLNVNCRGMERVFFS